MKRLPSLLLACAGFMHCAGCEFWNRSSPGLSIDPGNIGSGQLVVSPINDSRFWDGEAMDLSTRRPKS